MNGPLNGEASPPPGKRGGPESRPSDVVTPRVTVIC